MCVSCFLERLKAQKSAFLTYFYNNISYKLSVKVEIFNGNFSSGEAFLFLKRNNEEWSSPIETDSLYKDIIWMNLYVSDIFELQREVKVWLVNGGSVPIRSN